MPNVVTQRNIGALIAQSDAVVKTDAGGSTNGNAVDRQGKLSCVLMLATGAATGTPTTQTADAKLQDSDDGATGWADLSGAAVTQIAADNGKAYVDVNLTGAKRYVRIVTDVAFTGGTSPDWAIAAQLVLGGADTYPQA